MSSKKERNHYDLKEMENIKTAKIVSIHVLFKKFEAKNAEILRNI